MTIPPSTTRYKRHRFPAEIISHGVWLDSNRRQHPQTPWYPERSRAQKDNDVVELAT